MGDTPVDDGDEDGHDGFSGVDSGDDVDSGDEVMLPLLLVVMMMFLETDGEMT